MIPVAVKVDGLMLVVVGLAVVGAVVWTYRKNIAASVNPADENNIVNQAAGFTVQELSGGKYQSVADYTWQTRQYNPLAWAFEGIGRLTGDL